MNEWTVESKSVEETQAFARELTAGLPAGTVVALVGDLGMGKTHFVQGMARALGVPAGTEVVSPTYALVNEYQGSKAPLVHMDFYRLLDADSAYGLGIEEHIHSGAAIVAIEWADHLEELIPKGAVWIRFEWVSENERVLHVRGAAPL
jgi:tRNA threonylcarbamoyladenosine biosynthesis protein TsaE